MFLFERAIVTSEPKRNNLFFYKPLIFHCSLHTTVDENPYCQFSCTCEWLRLVPTEHTTEFSILKRDFQKNNFPPAKLERSKYHRKPEKVSLKKREKKILRDAKHTRCIRYEVRRKTSYKHCHYSISIHAFALTNNKKIWNWIIWTKSIRKIQQQQNTCVWRWLQQHSNGRNGFYTKIIAFVMCNVTNLSTKPSVVKASCQMRRTSWEWILRDRERNENSGKTVFRSMPQTFGILPSGTSNENSQKSS